MNPPCKSTPEALLAAYIEASGFPVSMSRQRREWLAQICEMPARFTADDVRAVIATIHWHLKKGTKGWVSGSLLFGNCMRPETFEERALMCRAHAARRKPRPVNPIPHTDPLGTTRLVEPPIAEPPRADFIAGFERLRQEIGK